MTMTTTKDCRDCKHHSASQRPRVVDQTGFDDQIEFSDEDETVYVCQASEGPYANGKEVGTIPVSCSSWAARTNAGADRLAELDRMIAAQEERLRKKRGNE
jgi:hypothetical protein